MARWEEVPLDKELFRNTDETLLSNVNAAMENCYMNEADGQSAFPGRKRFADLPSGTRTYLHDWRENLVAVTDEGRVYRFDENANREDVTGTQVSGGRRVVFAKTEEELLMAAGGPIIRLAKSQSEVLSEDAPESTHVAFVDSYVIAIEPYSGRFFHSATGAYRSWDPLDLFSASGKPDDLNACIVTPYRELLMCGEDSIEQYERLTAGNVPFFRRWSTGEGLFAPYTLVASDNGTYGVNKLREFVRFSQQVSRPESDEINYIFEKVRDWREAWAAQIHIKGQKFILLQIPHALNLYGTPGITALFDYRARHWSNLYDWDEEEARPRRWAPWSYHPLWGRHFVGVEGGIEELDPESFTAGNRVQRFLVRSGHVDKWGPSRIGNFRIRLRRGVTPSNATTEAKISLRVNRDNRGFGRWKHKGLGRPGQREMILEFGAQGSADTWQFEYRVSDDVPVEIVGAKAYVERLGW